MKKLLGWIILLAVIFCLVQYLRAVASATAFDTFLQDEADKLSYQDPQAVEEAILVRADDAGIYLQQDYLQVLTVRGGAGSISARYVVPVRVPMVQWQLERTFSTQD
jgi:hypothetical protein